MQTQYIVLLALYLLTCLGLARLFEKAGEKGWKGFVPGYNFYVWLKIIKQPWWWLLLLIVPGVNFLMLAIMSIELAKAFGKKSTIELASAALIGFIYLPFIGFQGETKYMGPPEKSKLPKSATREWVDAIVFAVIAATVIRTFFLEAFTIPTSSLEKSLMVGDYLFVSKMSYGAKVPNTPLAFPFAHHTLPMTENTKSYLEWIKLPYMRLPGFGEVKNNDYVVFNYPDGDTVASKAQNQSYYELCRQFGREYVWNKNTTNPYSGDRFGKIIARPPDKRENYVKRCVGIPGDTLTIKNRTLYINGSPSYVSENMQHSYRVRTKGLVFTKQMKEDFDLTEKGEPYMVSDSGDYVLTLPFSKLKALEQLPNVVSVTPLSEDNNKYAPDVFPHSSNYKWNKDNFGPLLIPEKGMTVHIDTFNIGLYDRIIEAYELNELEVRDGKIYINGAATDKYTFQMDYYFMMGDNRHNSADSRFWGFVPEDHIVGKAVFVWMSLKDEEHNGESGKLRLGKLFSKESKMRWNRFFTVVHSDGLSRSYLIHFIVIVASISGYNYFRRKRNRKSAS